MLDRKIPFFVNRALDYKLSNEGYIRSDKNKNLLWMQIQHQLPNMPDDVMNQQAIDDAMDCVTNEFSQALKTAFKTCTQYATFVKGDDELPCQCSMKATFTNPNATWPASSHNLQAEWENITEAEFRRLYLDENLSDRLIAERFGVSKSAVTKKRKDFGISIVNNALEKTIKAMNDIDKMRPKLQIDIDKTLAELNINFGLHPLMNNAVRGVFEFINQYNPQHATKLIEMTLAHTGFKFENLEDLCRKGLIVETAPEMTVQEYIAQN